MPLVQAPLASITEHKLTPPITYRSLVFWSSPPPKYHDCGERRVALSIAANHDKLLASFLELLEAIESSTPSDAKDSLQKVTLTHDPVALKQTQRKLFQHEASVHRAFQEKRTLLLWREMLLSNELYEKQFLQHKESFINIIRLL